MSDSSLGCTLHDPHLAALRDDDGCGGFIFRWIMPMLITTGKGRLLSLLHAYALRSPSSANLPALHLLYYHFALGPNCHNLDASCTDTGPKTG